MGIEAGDDREGKERVIQDGKMEVVWGCIQGEWEGVLLGVHELEADEMVQWELWDSMKGGDHELQE